MADDEILNDETCRAIAEGKLVPQNATPAEHEQAQAALVAAVTAPKPPRKMALDELQRLLERDSDVPLQILPNGEIREADTGERTERKPLTMRDNLGGEYAEPEHILGSPEFDKVVEEVLAAYRPHQVLAIAAAVIASTPGLFSVPDVLPPIDVSRYRKAIRSDERIPGQLKIVDEVHFAPRAARAEEVPPLEKRPGHRSGYRVGLTTKGGGKPPGSKLARKAARGKL